VFANLLGRCHLDGAGVRLLLGDAGLGQVVDYRLGFDFQLPSQFIDPNLGFVGHPAG
jgi:hypothetical protein